MINMGIVLINNARVAVTPGLAKAKGLFGNKKITIKKIM